MHSIGDAERALPDARRRLAGPADGAANGNYRRGRFTREAVEKRQQVRRMLRRVDELIDALTAGCSR